MKRCLGTQQQYEELTETVEPAVEGSLLHDVLARFMAGHLHEKLTKYPPTELISQLDDIMTSVCDEYITGKKIAVTDFWPSQRRKLNLLLTPLAAAGACIPERMGTFCTGKNRMGFWAQRQRSVGAGGQRRKNLFERTYRPYRQ